MSPMHSARFDFETLQPSILKMIRSARSRLHRSHSSSERVENSSRDNLCTADVKNGTDPISAVRAPSGRRSSSRGHRFTRSRSSLGQETTSENALPEKPQAPKGCAVLGDATNTYSFCAGERPSHGVKAASPAKPKAPEQRVPQTLPLKSERDMGVPDGVGAQQSDNPQHAAEYAQDIFQVLKHKESSELVSPTYMDRQVHVSAKMRGILIDWLVDVHKKYKLRAETLFLTVQIIDRYLEVQVVQRSQLQLMGATSLMIAAKFEEVYPPKIKEFEYVTDRAYTRDEILRMEVCILKVLNFNICCPTAMNFLDRYQIANGCSDAHRNLAQYLLELSLVEYKMLKYGPSHSAAAAILLSNKLLGRPSWTPTLARYTQTSESALKDCAKELCALLENAEANSLQAVRKKFSQATYHSVAKLNFMASHGDAAISLRRGSTGGA